MPTDKAPEAVPPAQGRPARAKGVTAGHPKRGACPPQGKKGVGVGDGRALLSCMCGQRPRDGTAASRGRQGSCRRSHSLSKSCPPHPSPKCQPWGRGRQAGGRALRPGEGEESGRGGPLMGAVELTVPGGRVRGHGRAVRPQQAASKAFNRPGRQGSVVEHRPMGLEVTGHFRVRAHTPIAGSNPSGRGWWRGGDVQRVFDQ